jgi:hypothetical protein
LLGEVQLASVGIQKLASVTKLSKQRQQRESSAKAALTRKFRALRDDATIKSMVARKTTIRALVTYVREKHFADDDIDERTLKDRVTELRDLLLAHTT